MTVEAESVPAEWQRHGARLDIIVDGDPQQASSEEIYALVFDSSDAIRGRKISIATRPDGLSFSRYPAALAVAVVSAESGMGGLACAVRAEAGGVAVDISLEDSAPDHCIIGDRWFPLATGARESVRITLKSAGILEPGPLSLKQYLELRKISAVLPGFCDTIPQGDIKADFTSDREPAELVSFRGNLYPYQRDGWQWLTYIWSERLGAILADEMGLGKTIQLIALLASPERDEAAPSLVVGPATLMENWRREIDRFAPGLKTVIHQGARRTGDYRALLPFDVVITSYDTVVRDGSMFHMVDWRIVILDEAQAIKNPDTARAKAVKELRRRCGIAVTGTPVENRLSDLWSLCDFALPGLLGDLESFELNFPDDRLGAAALEPLTSPIMLRRRVAEVAKDLPDRIDIPQVLLLSDDEAAEYERVRLETIAEYPQAASLVALTRLRMFCAHPGLLDDVPISVAAGLQFTKLQRLFEIVDEVFSAREKILVFTSYNRMADLIVRVVRERYGNYAAVINGETPIDQRQSVVDRFTQETGAALLALNPKAAGTGLNITAATHVVHYNLEWNPAVEDQASARAHRRGQDRPVTVHRLYFADSVEETVNDRLDRKRDLSETAVVGVDGKEETIADISKALQMSPVRKVAL
ncbi:DEAD/DEAH box helicase [Sphingomonas sp. RB56-2]|uniref:DEAD/DEAH box helicase n=1 Tax=Sphingomonas brevis TaxID=2908206 RepID=A0ABT0SBR6_9SPHN|nr:DEAD/DEAH box helicase [Sphingomonas brevis]MCL6741577.1 DEAD/DEAH box helicase [Sphingomonas brevis]